MKVAVLGGSGFVGRYIIDELLSSGYTPKMIVRETFSIDNNLEGVEISFIILELTDGMHRVSFRSSGQYTVNDVAKHFDGGGHKLAAGARFKDLSTNDIEKNIISKLSGKILGEF